MIIRENIVNKPAIVNETPQSIDSSRRKLIGAAGAGVMAVALGGVISCAPAASEGKVIRWGVIGTGNIANSMAPRIKEAESAELSAVSSRKMETANKFANKHGVPEAFDSWQKMIESGRVDAVYIATPTSVKEEISLAAVQQGVHVLVEKPFADLASLKRMTAACREKGVGFMDGTHFPHLLRTKQIREGMLKMAGRPWSVASAFQFNLQDTDNIRLIPALEPYGAIGDAGWYNMRAAVEYLPDDVELISSDARLKREPVNNAVISGSGVMHFSDGSTSTWNCGFNSGALVQDLRITGPDGVIWVDDFVTIRRDDRKERFRLSRGGKSEEFELPFSKHASALMFEDFAAMIAEPELFEKSVRASERTQAWLDAAWQSAIAGQAGA